MSTRTILLLFLLSGLSFCQEPLPAAHGMGAEYPWTISGTYMHVHTDASFGRPTGLNGGAASISRALWPSIRLTGEVGDYRKSGISVASFLAGPQALIRIWRVQPFLSVMPGVSHISAGVSGNQFTVAAGGGVDVPWRNHIKIRVLQCDYYRMFGGQYQGADFLRLGIGLTYSFGE